MGYFLLGEAITRNQQLTKAITEEERSKTHNSKGAQDEHRAPQKQKKRIY